MSRDWQLDSIYLNLWRHGCGEMTGPTLAVLVRGMAVLLRSPLPQSLPDSD